MLPSEVDSTPKESSPFISAPANIQVPLGQRVIVLHEISPYLTAQTKENDKLSNFVTVQLAD